MTLDNGIVTVVNDNCAFSLLLILQSIVHLYCGHLLQLFLPPLKVYLSSPCFLLISRQSVFLTKLQASWLWDCFPLTFVSIVEASTVPNTHRKCWICWIWGGKGASHRRGVHEGLSFEALNRGPPRQLGAAWKQCTPDEHRGAEDQVLPSQLAHRGLARDCLLQCSVMCMKEQNFQSPKLKFKFGFDPK